MKKLLLASLSMALMTIGSVATAADAAPPAAPTGSTATPAPAPGSAREARKEKRAEMKAEHGAMMDKVKAACAADVQATGCSQELGKGLMKCIHAYKKAHKEFTISESCKEAVHEGHEMHKEHKAEHEEMKGAAPAAPAAGTPTH